MQKHLQKNQKTVRSGFKPFCFLICFTVIIQNTFFLKLQHLKIIYASSIALPISWRIYLIANVIHSVAS